MVEFVLPKFAPGTWDRPVAGVYKMTFDANCFYIGSSVHLRRRIDQWRGNILGRYGQRFSSSVKKVIPNCKTVIFEVIEFADRGSVRDREDFYLQQHLENPLLLNLSPTATDNYGYKVVDDNGNHSSPYKVRKYDGNGNFIKEYRSVQRCADEEGVKISHIQRVLSGERKRLNGFVYKAEGYAQKKRPKVITVLERKNGRNILKLNAAGEVIESFTRIIDAAKNVGKTTQNVRRALSGYQKTCGGFAFKFSEP